MGEFKNLIETMRCEEANTGKAIKYVSVTQAYYEKLKNDSVGHYSSYPLPVFVEINDEQEEDFVLVK